jgi:predicted AAA+ superfamily ATPase
MKNRIFDPLLVQKSYFLLGPRQTGKSTLLRSVIDQDSYFDLLDPALFVTLTANPNSLVTMIEALGPGSKKAKKRKFIVLDEIQKLPQLLDTVQYLMARNPSLCFILTGSSARKLRRAGQNLLGGRARKIPFCPLTLRELSLGSQLRSDVILREALKYGGLPGIRESSDPAANLRDYVGVYLNEEIMAEALVRNLSNFSRFLRTASLANGQQVNYQKIANDAQVPSNTVRDYFDILEDTLIADRIEPYRPTPSRKFVSTPKFYFFDIGVSHFVTKKSVEHLSQTELGTALETLLYCELKAFKAYVASEIEIFYWRTQTGHEVDFLLEDKDNRFVAIEVKMTSNPDHADLKGLRELGKEMKLRRKILVCNVDRARLTEDGCEVIPVMKFVEQLWNREIL